MIDINQYGYSSKQYTKMKKYNVLPLSDEGRLSYLLASDSHNHNFLQNRLKKELQEKALVREHKLLEYIPINFDKTEDKQNNKYNGNMSNNSNMKDKSVSSSKKLKIKEFIKTNKNNRDKDENGYNNNYDYNQCNENNINDNNDKMIRSNSRNSNNIMFQKELINNNSQIQIDPFYKNSHKHTKSSNMISIPKGLQSFRSMKYGLHHPGLQSNLQLQYTNTQKQLPFNDHNKYDTCPANRMKRNFSLEIQEKKENIVKLNNLLYNSNQKIENNIRQLIDIEDKAEKKDFLKTKKFNNFFLSRNKTIDTSAAPCIPVEMKKRCETTDNINKQRYRMNSLNLMKVLDYHTNLNNMKEVNVEKLCDKENDKIKHIIKEKLFKNIDNNNDRNVKTATNFAFGNNSANFATTSKNIQYTSNLFKRFAIATPAKQEIKNKSKNKNKEDLRPKQAYSINQHFK